MQFWGVELKGDKPVKVAPVLNEVIHLSQATLADFKKGSNPVMLYAKVGDQKLAIGVLNGETTPQLSFDLVFEKEFELSHNMKNGSVHLTGYKSLMGEEEGVQVLASSDESDEEFPLEDKQNGIAPRTAETNANRAPAPAGAAAAAAKKDETSEDESDDDSDEDDSDKDKSEESDKENVVAAAKDSSEEDDSEEDDSDSEEDDSSSEEELPQNSAGGKKRPATDTETPVVKKAKLVTPQKTAVKKAVVHVDTPHPAKKAGKGDQSNLKTPKSAGQVTCGSCSKSFNSQNALDSHSKAKHSK